MHRSQLLKAKPQADYSLCHD